MVERVNLIRNVGQFDNVSDGAALPFAKLTVVYAQNGRGKTTLAAVLRSLSTGEPAGVTDRKRLGAAHDPHVIVDVGSGNNAIFQNGAWSAPDPRLVIFDDEFVAQNVCQGIAVDASQRAALHELILGAQGVGLSNALQTHVDQIEVHGRELRAKGAAIPAAVRGSLTIDAFCALNPVPNVDQAIVEVEARLAAARSAAAIAAATELPSLSLPAFDLAAVGTVLGRQLLDLDATAAARVQAHIAALGHGGERWLGEGVGYVDRLTAAGDDRCPFCEQALAGSALIEHYSAYFGEAYGELKATVADAIAANRNRHGGEVPAAFERRVREAVEAREFWQHFAAMPLVDLDTASIGRAWKAAREAVEVVLIAKQAAPLDPLTAPAELVSALANYAAAVQRVASIDAALTAANETIARVKAESGVAQVTTLERQLADLQTARARFDPTVDAACQANLAEAVAKKTTEDARDAARSALDTYRTTVFPQYRATVNAFLQRFNAGGIL